MAAKKKAVDKTVENQENPVQSEVSRESTETKPEPAEYVKNVPAHEVDETVENQMNPGINMVDRNPDPEIVTDSAGIAYDVSKAYPELVDTEDREAEKNKIRQDNAVLDARTDKDNDEDLIEIEFLENGFTTSRVWKKGETLRVHKDGEEPWMNLSEKEQKDLYSGRKMFERK